ncbi:hypothetical protein ACQPZ2_29225 [Nocardia pseudovaccinii]|uniref:hypothetical protein n=1 Tax=Nocardia pseudovaccinii TaxID=189540 RepID=UPI003D8AFED7
MTFLERTDPSQVEELRKTRRSRGAVQTASAVAEFDYWDRAILDFGVRWHPYGGGHPGRIFIEFGIDEGEYFRRLLRLVNPPDARFELTETDRAKIRSVCEARLRHRVGESPTPADVAS